MFIYRCRWCNYSKCLYREWLRGYRGSTKRDMYMSRSPELEVILNIATGGRGAMSQRKLYICFFCSSFSGTFGAELQADKHADPAFAPAASLQAASSQKFQ